MTEVSTSCWEVFALASTCYYIWHLDANTHTHTVLEMKNFNQIQMVLSDRLIIGCGQTPSATLSNQASETEAALGRDAKGRSTRGRQTFPLAEQN